MHCDKGTQISGLLAGVLLVAAIYIARYNHKEEHHHHHRLQEDEQTDNKENRSLAFYVSKQGKQNPNTIRLLKRYHVLSYFSSIQEALNNCSGEKWPNIYVEDGVYEEVLEIPESSGGWIFLRGASRYVWYQSHIDRSTMVWSPAHAEDFSVKIVGSGHSIGGTGAHLAFNHILFDGNDRQNHSLFRATPRVEALFMNWCGFMGFESAGEVIRVIAELEIDPMTAEQGNVIVLSEQEDPQCRSIRSVNVCWSVFLTPRKEKISNLIKQIFYG